MRIAIVFCLTLAKCAASVDFTYSTLYDIYDFYAKDEVHISRCDSGCLIFASTLLDGFVDSASGYDPYAENLIIHDNTQDRNFSITDLSRNFNETTSEKTPLTIWGPASISVLNLNAATDSPWPIVLYVIERTKANEFSYSVYDALNMKGIDVNPNGVVTVMSADAFTLTSTRRGSSNGLIARLTGFENVRNSNGDGCPRAFSIDTQNPFPGFNIIVNGPIISILFNERNSEQIDAARGISNIRSFDTDGFLTSPGYNGCTKPLSQGIQSFRSFLYDTSDNFLFSSNTNLYNFSFDVVPNLDATHSVTVNDVTNNQLKTITGYNKVSFDFLKTKLVEVALENLKSDQGFLMIYSSVSASASTTPATNTASSSASTMAGSTGSSSTATNTASSSPSTMGGSTGSSSTTSQPPTTSEGHAIEGSLLSALAAIAVARLA